MCTLMTNENVYFYIETVIPYRSTHPDGAIHVIAQQVVGNYWALGRV